MTTPPRFYFLFLSHTALRMRIVSLVGALIVLLAGCGINKDLMFKTPVDYQYEEFPDSTRSATYVISRDDVLDFRLFTIDGLRLIDMATINGDRNMQMNRQNMPQYLVDEDGTVKLPTIGRVEIAGYTLREAEAMLEERYQEYFNKPFVLLTVTNNRVIVSPGGGGTARVVPLMNRNTTLLEVLAQAGGINERGNAEKIKLIRLDRSNNRHVYEIDLSTIEGIRDADIIVQANDIVYVEPMPRFAGEVAQSLVPYVTLLTTTILVLGILNLR